MLFGCCRLATYLSWLPTPCHHLHHYRYSAVCGIGLDTVPIPGDTPVDKIASLMLDTGTMAFRLQKPLTVRLFPCPGLKAGDMTKFTSSDLCNCAVFAVP